MSRLEGHISYSFPSLSCLNFTCQFLFQTARLSIRTAELLCYCCTFLVNIKLYRVIQIWLSVLLKRKLFWIQRYKRVAEISAGITTVCVNNSWKSVLKIFRYFWIKSQWIESSVLVWLCLGIVCSCHTCREREAQDHPMLSLWIIRKHS